MNKKRNFNGLRRWMHSQPNKKWTILICKCICVSIYIYMYTWFCYTWTIWLLKATKGGVYVAFCWSPTCNLALALVAALPPSTTTVHPKIRCHWEVVLSPLEGGIPENDESTSEISFNNLTSPWKFGAWKMISSFILGPLHLLGGCNWQSLGVQEYPAWHLPAEVGRIFPYDS